MMTLDYTFERRLELQKEAAQRELDEMRKAVEEAVAAARKEAEEAKKEAVEAARREAEAKKEAVEVARREVKEVRKEAHAAGMTEGQEDKLWSLIQKKLIKGKTTAQIADELETTEEEIIEIIKKRQ